MTVPICRIWIPSLVLMLALAACEEGQLAAPSETAPAAERAEARVEIREVERPDIFSTTELALWDGRPSLGGIWVAHPDVREPERVLIRNTTNGQTIAGALFRRERLNPGPRIQLSSDAASALGVLAGQPTELSIVVVRQEEVVIEPEPLPVEETEPEPGPEAEQETAEAATAGTESDGDGATATAAAAVAAAETAEAAADGDAAPERKGFWARFRESLRDKPAEDDAAAVQTADDASVPDVETETLDPIAAAEAAIDEAEAAPAAADTAGSGLRNPFIQVGLYKVQENAEAAATSLRQGGIVPSIAEGRNDQGPFWRVLVGPMTTAAEQSDMLAQVKALGYSDAYLTAN